VGASRAALEQAAAIAERDDYVRSRGEILRNCVTAMPAGGAAASVKEGGGEREKQAIAALKARKLGVSADQLAPADAAPGRRRSPGGQRCAPDGEPGADAGGVDDRCAQQGDRQARRGAVRIAENPR
jgi:hypothetical protein